MRKSKWTYVISPALALLVGGLSALLTSGGMKEYASLAQPALAPPGIVFPIAWSVLFILMGVGAAIVYNSGSELRAPALRVYALQLIVNFLWSIIFFSLEWRLFAFIWILLLIALVLVMTIRFYRVSRAAAYMQLPYLLWLIFASYLNLGVWLLNG